MLAANFDTAEVQFLRREVKELEQVIDSLGETHRDETDRLMELESAVQEARETARSAECQRDETKNRLIELGAEADQQLAEVRAEADRRVAAVRQQLGAACGDLSTALGAAADRGAETRTMEVELRLLSQELLEADAESVTARASEASALSIARSYRSFAAQGAARLDDMRLGLDAVLGRLQAQLAELQAAAQQKLAGRALRAALAWRAARGLGAALRRWRAVAMGEEQRSALAARLEAAYRHRDADAAAARAHALAERVAEREAAEARTGTLQRELDAALDAAERSDSAAKAAKAAEAELQAGLKAAAEAEEARRSDAEARHEVQCRALEARCDERCVGSVAPSPRRGLTGDGGQCCAFTSARLDWGRRGLTGDGEA
jgi:hypothetical protein